MKKLFWLAVALILLCLMSCARDEVPAESSFPSSATVINGEQLEVRLAGNPATGYEWSWFAEGNDVLEEVSCEYIPEDSSGLRDGAGGVYLFVFEGKQPGETVLHFRYERPWENKDAAAVYDVSVAAEERDGRLWLDLQ